MFALFFLSRLAGLFTYISPSGKAYGTGDAAIMPVLFGMMSLVFSIPVFVVLSRFPEKGITGLVRENSMPYRLTGAFYTLFFLWAAFISAERLVLFTGTVLFKNESTAALTVLLLVSSAFAASKGLEAAARAASVFFFVLSASLILALIPAAGRFDTANLTPPFYNGIGETAAAAFHSMSRTCETAAFGVLSAKLNCKGSRVLISGFIAFSVSAALLFLFIGGVTGKFGEIQLFPLYNLASAAKLGFFERLDSAVTGLWLLSAFIRTALFISAGTFSAEHIPVLHGVKGLPFYFAAAVFVTVSVFSFSSVNFGTLVSSGVFEIIFIAGTTVLPSVLLIRKGMKT